MLAVNSRTGEFLVDNFNRDGKMMSTGFTIQEYNKTQECREFITLMHSHSLNGRPSATDLLSYLNNKKVNLSLIICHNGDVYAIYGVKPEFKKMFTDIVEELKNYTNDEKRSKVVSDDSFIFI